VGRGSRGWGEIRWIIQVDRSGETDDASKLDSFVTKSVLVDV